MKKISLILMGGIIPACLLLSAGCRKEPLNNLTQEESRIYITNRDSTVDFSTFSTFGIVDSVAVIENDGQTHHELTSGDQQLLQQVRAEMEARGYVYISKEQNPDLGINVTRISNKYLNLVQYPYQWWDYGGYWDPYYWGYPGYDYYFPPMFGYYQSQEDVLAIDLIDLKDASGTKKELKGLWNATIRGEGVLDKANYEQEVNAVFDQSPYLKSEKQ